MERRARDWAGAAIALVIAGVCVRLGFWQLDRLDQRRERNALVRAARERPPLELGGAGLSPDSAQDRRLVARGVFDYGRERVWPGRTSDGAPGVHLVTPLRLSDGAAVFVDRGWVPSPDAVRVNRDAYREADSAIVEGYGRRAPRGRGDVDPGALRDSFPYALLDFVIEQELPPPSAALVRPGPPALTDGPHLSYAIQWFSFAVIIVVGTVALLRRRDAETARR